MFSQESFRDFQTIVPILFRKRQCKNALEHRVNIPRRKKNAPATQSVTEQKRSLILFFIAIYRPLLIDTVLSIRFFTSLS